MVPGTKPIKPTVRPRPPPGAYTRRSFGPREGGEIFTVLLKTATKIFKLVSKTGRNVASMATPITVLVGKMECRIDKIQSLGFDTKDIGKHYLLETNCIADMGADISCTTDEVRGPPCQTLEVVLQELEDPAQT